VRPIETRLLEGPNVYRLEPVMKVEVGVGRRRTWYGRRDPEPHALVRLGARVAPAEWPRDVQRLVGWTRRLRRKHGEGSGPVTVHRSSDPGHWIVVWAWSGAERATELAAAALALANRGADPGPAAGLTAGQRQLLEEAERRIAAAAATPPAWIRDAERRVPAISISGTNGKSTTTRLISHILRTAGRHVGTTTSDGILVDDRMVRPGDWTGPGGAQEILRRDDIDVAVLETARGGIVLRGLGYESNDVSILTNVSSDHLDLQGIHTLPELAEVKATVCRMTRPNGWVILNADDRYVAAVARIVRAQVAFFSLDGERSPVIRRHLARGGRAYLVRDGTLGEANGARWSAIGALRSMPIAFGGAARHNVANALAASGGARALGASIAEVRRGLASFEPTTDASPGRLNVFRRDGRLVVVDFAHNEAGLNALLDVAEVIARGGQVTAIIGTAGDRPDDTLRGMGRIAAQRAGRLAIKESLHYLRGRTRESVVGELQAGARSAGWRGEIPVYESEVAALTGELARDDDAVIVLLCHEDRDAVFRQLDADGFIALRSSSELAPLLA
jgi:cyanophycin synthetase